MRLRTGNPSSSRAGISDVRRFHQELTSFHARVFGPLAAGDAGMEHLVVELRRSPSEFRRRVLTQIDQVQASFKQIRRKLAE